MRRLTPAAVLAITWLFIVSLPVAPAESVPEIDRYGGLGWATPAIAADANGNPEQVFLQPHADGTHSLFWEDNGLWHVLLDSSGKLLTQPLLLGKTGPTRWTAGATAPYFARDSAGRFHLAWDTGTEVHYAMFDSQGKALVPDRVLRSNPYGVHGASLSLRSDGQLMLGYVSYEAGHGEYRFVVARLDSAGNLLGENSYPSGDGSQPLDGTAAPSSDGGIHIVLATGAGGLYLRIGPSGSIEASLAIPLLPRGVMPVLAVGGDGTPVLAWNTWEGTGAGRIVAARVSGQEESIYITSSPSAVSDPSVAVERSGEVLLSWRDTRSGNGSSFYARLMPGAWDPYPPNVRIPVAGADAVAPALMVDSGNRVFAAWAEGHSLVHVRAYSYSFEVGSVTGSPEVHPRKATVISVEFQNIGGISDTLALTLDTSGLPAGWKATISTEEVALASGGTGSVVTVTITGPEGIDGPRTGSVRLRAASVGDPLNSRDVTLPVTLEVSYSAGASLSPAVLTASPGSEALFELEVRNLGDAADELTLSAEGESHLALSFDSTVLPLGWGESSKVGVSAAVSQAAGVGDALGFKVSVTSRRSGEVEAVAGTVVVTPAVRLRLFSTESQKEVTPGSSDTFNVTVANDGNLEGGAQVYLEVVTGSEGWNTALDPAFVVVPPETERTVTLTVFAPAGAGAGSRLVIRVQATDSRWGSLASTTVTAVARPTQGLWASARSLRASGLPGAEILAPLTVANTGNAVDTVSMRFTVPAAGWRVEALRGGASTDSLVLEPGASALLTLSIIPSPEAAAGDYTLGARFEGRSGTSAALNLTVTVEQYFDLSLYTPAPNMRVVPGELSVAVLHLRNFGNGPDRVLVEAKGPVGWVVGIKDADMADSSTFSVAAGGLTNIILELQAPNSASDAWSDVSVSAYSLSGLRTSLTLRVGMLLPDLALDVSYSPAKFENGKMVMATVTVTNTGEAPARSVTVSFQVDAGTTRSERILLIPRNSEKIATFTWTPSPGYHSLRFEVDSEHSVLERDEANNVYLDHVTVAGSSSAAPAISPAVAAAAIVGTVAAVAAAVGGGTEYGKYGFFAFFVVPLYTKIKKDDVLDHFVRGQVYGYIKANPGEHYNSIKKALSLKNGTLVYHLKTLEREEFIKSIIDGRFKRFYPKEMKIPEPSGELVLKMTRIQREILEIIRAGPGISQKEIAEKIGLSTPTVHYHIDIMLSARVIRVEHSGRETKCYIEDQQAA